MTPAVGLAACLALALGAAQDRAPSLEAANAAQSAQNTHGKLPWFAGTFEQLGAQAKAEQRAVMVFLWCSGCRWCPRLEAEALSDAGLQTSLEGVLLWNADGEQASGKLLAGRFGAVRFPLVLFFDGEGHPADRLDGYLPKARFCAEVARVLRNEGTLRDLSRQLDQRPDDLDLRTRYADKLESLGDRIGHAEQIEEIRGRDGKRTSLPMRRELYVARLLVIQEHYDRTREINPGPLVRFLEEERHSELLFEGYGALSAMHAQRAEELERAQQLEVARSKRSDLRSALTKAAACVPDVPATQVGFALDTIATFARFPGELSAADRTLLLRLSTVAVGVFPENARVQASSALASFCNGDRAQASSALRRALELDPDNPEWIALGRSMGL